MEKVIMRQDSMFRKNMIKKQELAMELSHIQRVSNTCPCIEASHFACLYSYSGVQQYM